MTRARIRVDRSDSTANETGIGSLSIPRHHPFVELVGGSYDHAGRAVFHTAQQREEFIARWNDSEWGERFGKLTWNDSDLAI